MTQGLLDFHIDRNLIEWYMTWPFYHHLHIFVQIPLHQRPKTGKLINFAAIRNIGQTAGTTGIPQRNSHIIDRADIQNFVKILVKRILLSSHAHPNQH